MILGIIGFILGIVLTVFVHIAFVWLVATGILAFASGLQGILVTQKGTAGYNCHIVLAVFNLVNLGIIGVTCIFLLSPLLVIWAIAAFVIELWVTISRFCCNTGPVTQASGAPQYATAQPAVHVHVGNGGGPRPMHPAPGYAAPPPQRYPPHENLKTPAYN
jgi:hypothetical protein